MNCPRDDATLADATVYGCRFEKCPACHGLWFDTGVMQELFKLPCQHIEDCVQLLAEAKETSPPHLAGYMRCPRCIDARLQGITYTLASSIRINRCENCLGLWVDETELDAILREEKWLESEYSPKHLWEHLTRTSGSHRPWHRACTCASRRGH